MTTYNVGDRIIMTLGANGAYSITREGSTGVITNVYNDSCEVSFDYVTGTGWMQEYVVLKEYFRLLAPVVVLSTSEIVAKKVKLMWGRQKYAKSQQVMV